MERERNSERETREGIISSIGKTRKNEYDTGREIKSLQEKERMKFNETERERKEEKEYKSMR